LSVRQNRRGQAPIESRHVVGSYFNAISRAAATKRLKTSGLALLCILDGREEARHARRVARRRENEIGLLPENACLFVIAETDDCFLAKS
jgi:hypothetical protein